MPIALSKLADVPGGRTMAVDKRVPKWTAGSVADVLPVRRRIHQGVGLSRLCDVEDDHPSLAVGIFVHKLGLVHESLVDLDDRSADRRENLAHGLHGLDGPDRLSLLDGPPDRRELNVHDVRQLILGKVRDPNPDALAFELRPLMVLRVAQRLLDVLPIDSNRAHSIWSSTYY